MAELRPCEICDNQAQYVPSDFFPGRRCPRCGEFDYDTTVGWRKLNSSDEMVRLSGWVREQNAVGAVPVRITPETSRRVAQMPMPGLRERTSRALIKLAKDKLDALFIRDAVSHDLEMQAISYSLDEQGVDLLIRILIEEGSLRFTGGSCAVTAKGLLAAEALGADQSSSAQGFVAMSFDPSLREAWADGFDPGIRTAGFRPLRLDTEDYIGGLPTR